MIRVFVFCLALLVIAGCNKQTAHNHVATPSPSPVGPAAAVQTRTYEGVGIVKSLNPDRPGIEIDHEEVVGLMPAMQMEFPVPNRSLLNGIAVNDRIDFTIEDGVGEMTVVAIKKK
ncbi:MAG TPA: copper-binding protein [Pyrinomonadaceae bacterium]|nr:copper-binding protein [Pyrinomonadaceae bacterium]